MLAAITTAPVIERAGLYGMSGVAQRVMAVVALEVIGSHDGAARWSGLASVMIVIAKAVGEATTGHLLFDTMHWGRYSFPLLWVTRAGCWVI